MHQSTIWHWLICHDSPVILPYILKTIRWRNVKLSDNESVWPNLWSQNKCRSRWPLFHCPVILPYILKTTWWMNAVLWDNESSMTFDFIINIGHNYLYFMVWRFCFTSSMLFNGWTSYFGIMRHYEMTFDLSMNVGHSDHYFMIHWFCLISWTLFEWWTSYFGIMSQCDKTFDLWDNESVC